MDPAQHRVNAYPHEEHELPRVLNASHATSIVVGIIIGSGIFLVPREMMAAVGSSVTVYAVWIVGGLLSLFGAMTYAEFAAARPKYGGEYAFLREAYGDLTAFVFMWTQVTIAKPSSIASIASGVVRVLGNFSAFSFLSGTFLPHVVYGQLVAIAFVWLITGLNILGTRKAGNIQRVLMGLKVAMVLTVVGICIFGGHGTTANFSTHHPGARGGFAGFMVALIAALWAYDGWNLVTTVAGEIKQPQRSLPIALIAGVATVAALYMLLNAAVQYVMPASAVAASPRPASDAMQLAMGAAGAAIVSAGMALSMLVTLNGSTMTGARVPFALARDRYFFQGLAKVHPRFHTPSTALVVQAILAIIFLLFAGSFQELFSVTLFGEWLFYMLVTSTVFIFRFREPGAERPYKTWGYPVVPALFIVASAVLLYYTFSANLRNSFVGSALILAGVPVFYAFQRRREAT